MEDNLFPHEGHFEVRSCYCVNIPNPQLQRTLWLHLQQKPSAWSPCLTNLYEGAELENNCDFG